MSVTRDVILGTTRGKHSDALCSMGLEQLVGQIEKQLDSREGGELSGEMARMLTKEICGAS